MKQCMQSLSARHLTSLFKNSLIVLQQTSHSSNGGEALQNSDGSDRYTKSSIGDGDTSVP